MSNIKALINTDTVKDKFVDLLGVRQSKAFLSSVIQVVNDNKLLQNADPKTILTAAATAATLNLPVNKNLGFSWIVPFKGKAQFQMGWRGFVQLAQRTGQYKSINVVNVYENQFKSFNYLSEELDADFSIDGKGSVVGYVAMFKLLNGFSKTVYWSKSKVEKHAKKYSQSYGKSFSPWSSDFDAMARKTVLKNTLSNWGIMSIELTTAIQADQSVQDEEGQFDYLDNQQQGEIVILPNLDSNHAHWSRIVSSLKSDAITIDQVKSKYSLTTEAEKQLKNAINK